MVPSHQDYPRVFRNISEGAIFILRKISKKLPRFSENLREMFSFLQNFLDFFPQCPPFFPFSLLCLAHSREIIRLIYARICNFAQNYGEKARTTA